MAKSMRELVARKQYKIVQRFIDTFNDRELELIAEYIEQKRSGKKSDNELNQVMENYAASVGCKLVKEDDAFFTTSKGKKVRRIDYDGNIYKPKGKKVLGSVYDE